MYRLETQIDNYFGLLVVTYNAGFYPKHVIIFESIFNDLLGQTLNVVHPNDSTGFSYKYVYPDKTTIRSGADYEAIKCLSEMLNFKIK
jgi:hypothetical protein